MNAKEAKKISEQNDVDETIDSILFDIRVKAMEGKKRIEIRDYGFNDVAFYEGWGDYPEKGKKIIEHLWKLGYEAQIKHSVWKLTDIYLEVDWSNA